MYGLIQGNTDKENKKLRKLLKRKKKLNFLPWNRMSPDLLCDYMRHAALSRNTEALKALRKAGGDLNRESYSSKKTIMHIVAQSCNTDMLVTLIEAGGDVNATTELGSPLHFAANG